MKNFISIILVFSATSALAQINLPKLPKLPKISQVFKKSDVSGLKVQWSCPQEDYKKIAQLPTSSEVTVSVDENGEVSYHPNIFKIKPLSKQFFQGINPLGKKNGPHKVSYDDCLDRFYSNIAKAHSEYKKDCSSGDRLCDYENKFLTQKSKKAVDESRYFSKKENVTFVPGILPGSSVYKLSTKEVLQELNNFCKEDRVIDQNKLFSQSVMEQVRILAKPNQTQFPGLVCLKKYKNAFNAEIEKIKSENCADGSKNPVCSVVEENVEKITGNLDEVINLTNQAITKEEKNFEYRYGKPVDGKLVDEHFKTTFIIPTQNCGYGNHVSIGKNTNVNISRYDKEIYDNLDKIFSEGSVDCQKMFLQNYIASKTSISENDEQFKKFCELHKTEYCEKVFGEKQFVEKNIESMIKTIYGEVGERYYDEQIACIDETEMTLTDILNKVKDSQKALRCMDTKKGEFVNVSQRSNYGVRTGDYTIKDLGDRKYEAYFNIEFQDNAEAKTTAKELMARTQKCMADISPFLKGPGGEELTIKILNKENGLEDLPLNQRPNKTNIGIAASGFRSHSLKYEEDVDCPTIAHEVMHLFGLCDEYKEQWLGEGNNYACRTVPKAVSLMKRQSEMFDIAVDKEFSCDCSSKGCKDIMNGSDEDKRKLFLSQSLFEAIPYQDRAEFCKFQSLPNQKYTDLKIKKGVVVLEDKDNLLTLEGRDLDYSSTNIANRTKFTCSCEANDERCFEFLETTRNFVDNYDDYTKGSCPSGTQRLSSAIGNSAKSPNVKYDPQSGRLNITKKAKAPSLLHPSHFERILGGACEDKGKKYLECAKFAYQNGECEVPEHCKDDSAYLGIKQ